MNAAPIRSKPETDDRPCFVCDKVILFGSTRTQGESHTYAMAIHPVTGEWRWIHAVCGLNKHTSTKRRLRWVMCDACGLPLRGDHGNYSGERFTAAQLRAAAPADYRASIADDAEYGIGGYAVCRDGGLFVRGRDMYSERPAEKAATLTDLDAAEFPPAALEDDGPPPADDRYPEHVPPF